MRLIISIGLILAAILATLPSPPAMAGNRANNFEDVISGDWELVINNQGETHKMNLKLRLDGENVSGNFESSTPLGNGSVSGTWTNTRIDLKVTTSHAAMTLTGTMKNGKLSGDWDTGHMAGKWEATRKKASKPSSN